MLDSISPSLTAILPFGSSIAVVREIKLVLLAPGEAMMLIITLLEFHILRIGQDALTERRHLNLTQTQFRPIISYCIKRNGVA